MKRWHIEKRVFQALGLLVLLLLTGCDAFKNDTTTTSIDFSALWTEETPPTTLQLADNQGHLETKMQELGTEGLRLEDFEMWNEKGERRFAGLFRAAGGSRMLHVDLDAAGFEAQRQQYLGEGLRLLDVEIAVVDDVRKFSGLWAPGGGAETVVTELSALDFEQEWPQLSDTHRLIDFETWWQDGEVRVFFVYRAGAGEPGEQIMIGMTWDSFEAEVHTRADQGFRLIDFEIIHGATTPICYSGRWVAGTSADWLGISYSRPQLIRADRLLRQGHRTSGVDVNLDWLLPAPSSSKLNLLDLEVMTQTFPEGATPNQGKPLHDSGTAGPP